MVLVALLAKHTNRDYKASRILGFTIVLMLAPNPLLLVFDPSFQLSVLATIGLIWVSPLVSEKLTAVTERFGLREILSTTIATQVTVLPFLVYSMGNLSLVSLPVNILILSFIPLTMLLGFVTGLFGLVSLYLSFIPGVFTYALLRYELFVVRVGASIPMSEVMLPAFSPAFLIVIYVAIFAGLHYFKKRYNR
jgi:competence protein ComEC